MGSRITSSTNWSVTSSPWSNTSDPGKKAVIVGHDWGGLVAWTFAMTHPELTDRLIVLNLPHPRGIFRELATNPRQQKNSQYARNFQQSRRRQEGLDQRPGRMGQRTPRPAKSTAPHSSARRWRECSTTTRQTIRAAPKRPRHAESKNGSPTLPPVKCPVLLIHGLKDQALLPGALNDTWNWVDSDLTLVTIPGAGHFVQQDAAELVTRTIVAWLMR